MFENRDKRFYATVTYDGAYMGPTNNPIYQIQTWIDKTTMDEKTLQYSSLHTGFVIWRQLNQLQLAVLHNRPLVVTTLVSTLTSTSLTMTEH